MKLLIVDDYEVVRKGLIGALDLNKVFSEINETGDIDEALKILRLSKPDIAIVDVILGHKGNGLKLIEKSKLEYIKTKFVVFTASTRKDDFNRARALGVSAYILKESDIEDIDYAIKRVIKGKCFYDSSLQLSQTKDLQKEVKERLTDREYDVLKALGKGLTNQQIAQLLFITENTVKKHISSLLAKLQLAHRTEAALYAAKLWRRAED